MQHQPADRLAKIDSGIAQKFSPPNKLPAEHFQPCTEWRNKGLAPAARIILDRPPTDERDTTHDLQNVSVNGHSPSLGDPLWNPERPRKFPTATLGHNSLSLDAIRSGMARREVASSRQNTPAGRIKRAFATSSPRQSPPERLHSPHRTSGHGRFHAVGKPAIVPLPPSIY